MFTGIQNFAQTLLFFWVTCSFNASPMWGGGDLGLNGDMHLEEKKKITHR